MAHPLKALGQDALEKAVQETLGWQADDPGAVVLAVAVTEGDELAVVVENPLGAEGGARHVSGEVLQSRFAAADELHVGTSGLPGSAFFLPASPPLPPRPRRSPGHRPTRPVPEA